MAAMKQGYFEGVVDSFILIFARRVVFAMQTCVQNASRARSTTAPLPRRRPKTLLHRGFTLASLPMLPRWRCAVAARQAKSSRERGDLEIGLLQNDVSNNACSRAPLQSRRQIH
jgi:hypothetical protein